MKESQILDAIGGVFSSSWNSNKPNPNQISMTNGKMATVNGAGPVAYHTAGGGRACESCYSKCACVCVLRVCVCGGSSSIKCIL